MLIQVAASLGRTRKPKIPAVAEPSAGYRIVVVPGPGPQKTMKYTPFPSSISVAVKESIK
jgi:hypothetical protein